MFSKSDDGQAVVLTSCSSPLARPSRRDLLKAGLIGVAAGIVTVGVSGPVLAAGRMASGGGAQRVSFRNAHTGDSFDGVYKVGGKYLPDAFDRINYVLRDFRTGEDYPIDPRCIDIISMVQQRTQRKDPLEVLSGYRSPRTNNMLRSASSSSGVARNSLHMTGQAIDFRMPGFSTARLRDISIDLRAGGVGYYARSNFVHVDTGKVRHW